ncbi:mechanosensitive ion channel family protein [Nitratireductor sp. GCM10026969]|uniref:mechanosensitive ion channel family protein n=1 Tax=Nitratireductor sp. GCM10026969 TaxID=3252645 RepID=UPI003620D51A
MDQLLNEGTEHLAALTEAAPGWLVSLVILLVAIAVALVLHQVLHRILLHLVRPYELFWHQLVARTRRPLRLAFVLGGLALGATWAPLKEGGQALIHHILLIGFVAILMWLAQLALNTFMALHLQRFEHQTDDPFLARRHITQSRILQRIAGTLIIVLGIGAMLMTFDTVRQYGISLLASAGAAGIIVGLALQPMLKNLFAGIQLAITQPIRINDALIVEGEFGNVEEITSTYVVVRAWDRRRLIIPLNYFIEQPFQNWTRDETALTGIVLLYLDFSVPLDMLREKAREIVEASPLWDGEVFALQVTDLRETSMEVRILASAANSGNAFELRCNIRELLVAFLVQNYPQALPRVRAETEGGKPSGRVSAARRQFNREGGSQ